MTHDDSFMEAIRIDPDSDELRLVYADWLEEHGNPRGEFIRAQIAIEAMHERQDFTDFKHLLPRAHELLNTHEEKWLGPIAGLIEQPLFKRGFLHSAIVPMDVFLKIGETICRAAPEFHLILRGKSELIPELAHSPHLSHVGGLTIRGADIDYLAVDHLVHSPHLRSLRLLDLSENHLVDTQAARLLAAASCLANLSRLNLSGDPIEDLGLQALLASPHLRSLTELDVRDCHIGETGVRTLARSSFLKQLTKLGLGGNAIGNSGVRALANSPYAANLLVLRLDRTEINSLAVQALADSPHLAGLVELGLNGNPITPEGKSRIQNRFANRAHF